MYTSPERDDYAVARLFGTVPTEAAPAPSVSNTDVVNALKNSNVIDKKCNS
jgi:hypothetical protein